MKPDLDPAFPGLATALDIDAVLELLRRALPECQEELEPIGGAIFDVQYKPGVNCTILYRLRFRNRATGRTASQLLSARLLRADESPPPLPQELLARYETFPKRVIRTPMVYLPGPRMVACAFPIDASLPGLIDAFDQATLKQRLSRMWGPRRVRVQRVAAEPLGYTPGARAAILYEVLNEVRETGLPEVRRLVGKIDAYRKPARLFASAWALWRAAKGRVRLAPPVGYIASANLWLQEHVQGIRLADLAGSGAFVKPVRQTARAIAAVHGLSLPVIWRRTPEKEAKAVHRWGNVLAAVHPDEARRVKRLRDRLASEMEARVQMVGPAHGDFHLANVLVGDNRVTLIDLDNMAYGDPLIDVGRFLASFRTSSLRVFGHPSGLAEEGEAFLEAYLAQVPEDERRVRLFEAASLLRSASSPFRFQREGWEDGAAMILDEAERVFSLAERRAAVPTGGVSQRGRSLENGMSWATDGQYLGAVLDPYIREAYGAEVTACQVRGTRDAGKVHHIHYRLSGRHGDDKWTLPLHGIIQRRGSGRGQFERLAALHRALDGNPEAPLLPRPITYLSSLNLQVVEEPSGVPLSSLLGTSDALGKAAKVGRALAALHGTPVDLELSRSLDDELRALRRLLGRLESRGFDLDARATALLAEAERRIRVAPERIAPVLRKLPLNHVLCTENRIALAQVEDVVLSHPLIDVGDVLARLTLIALSDGSGEHVMAVADRFREAYREATGATCDEMAPFEAMALLRAACSRAERDPSGIAAERLLARVDTMLGAR